MRIFIFVSIWLTSSYAFAQTADSTNNQAKKSILKRLVQDYRLGIHFMPLGVNKMQRNKNGKNLQFGFSAYQENIIKKHKNGNSSFRYGLGLNIDYETHLFQNVNNPYGNWNYSRIQNYYSEVLNIAPNIGGFHRRTYEKKSTTFEATEDNRTIIFYPAKGLESSASFSLGYVRNFENKYGREGIKLGIQFNADKILYTHARQHLFSPANPLGNVRSEHWLIKSKLDVPKTNGGFTLLVGYKQVQIIGKYSLIGKKSILVQEPSYGISKPQFDLGLRFGR